MKVIELLNKIADGEDVPERIKYDTKEMKYDHNKQDYLGYYSNGNGEWLFQYLFDRCRNTEHFINNEVEIIEDKPFNERVEEIYNRHIDYIYGKEDKKIEKLNIELNIDDENKVNWYRANNLECDLAFKINEIIEVLNERDIQRH